jgi:hypothetical protein
VNKAADEKKTDRGKHAAGVYERQDAYLYGHPQGRKKRFRSPADFFPHVLWLATDKEGDPKNCSCKICSPDGDEEPVEVATIKGDVTLKRETTKTIPQLPPARTAVATQNSMYISTFNDFKLTPA